MKLWELIKICSEGGYVEGDKFISNDYDVLFFDGEDLILESFSYQSLRVNSEWEYLNKEVK